MCMDSRESSSAAITNKQGSGRAELGSDGIRNKETERERERRGWRRINN